MDSDSCNLDIDISGLNIITPGSINTPESTRHNFTDSEYEILEENLNYHHTMISFIENLIQEGPYLLTIPKAPKKSLKLLFRPPSQSKRLTGDVLHAYLVQNLSTSENETCPKVDEVGSFVNLPSIIPHLQTGYSILKRYNASQLGVSIDYGNWLNVAFELHSIEKLTKKTTQTWKDWLLINVGICDFYGRKLREISTLLKNYGKFRRIGLSFSEIYSRRNEIRSMLILNPEHSKFWKN